jgi:hypothetical protein
MDDTENTSEPQEGIEEIGMDSSLYLKDIIFKKIVNVIIPPIIDLENRELIDSFVDSLANLAPISINITDIFYKRKTTYDPILNTLDSNHIKGIQDQMNKIFMNNFWSVYNKYSKDYIIYHKIQEMLHQYDGIGAVDKNMDYGFFENFESMFTEEKYIANREFVIRKGTKSAMEFAYKSIWKAKVEGIFQENYSFQYFDRYRWLEVTQGACINPDPPECTDPLICECTEAGKEIGTWLIAETIDNETLSRNPFNYGIVGSLLPIFFHTMVRDLAHPVGFISDYTRAFSTEWEDYFNTYLPFWADAVMVKSLCYNGDCSTPNTDYYVTTDGTPSITNSTLDNIQELELLLTRYINFKATKYIFKNKQFLLEYTQRISSGLQPKTIVEFYGNDFSTFEQLLLNNEFNNGFQDWSAGDRWSVAGGIVSLLDTGNNDILYQSFTFLGDTKYVLEVNVLEIQGEIKVNLSSVESLIIRNPGKHIIRLLNFNELISEVIVQDNALGSTCKIEYINLYEDLPNTIYNEDSHSAVLMDDFKRLPPVDQTYDIISFGNEFGDKPIIPDLQDPDAGDRLNEDLKIHLNKYPTIGQEISLGLAGSANELYTFTIGCYDPSDWSPENDYGYPNEDACCIANEPFNPPTWNPGDPCILANIIINNQYLQYIIDKLTIDMHSFKSTIPLMDPQGFDSDWIITSGNAVITPDGILKQDGSVESVIEVELDECPYNNDVLLINYEVIPEGTDDNITIQYEDGNGDILLSAKTGINIHEWGWIVENSSCDIDNPSKIRIILPIGYSRPMKNIQIYKY